MWIYIFTIVIVLLAVKYFILTAPFLPIKKQDLKTVALIVEKYEIKSLLDLGCGTGKVLSYLNKQNQELKLRGIEISAWSYLFVKIRFLLNKKVKIKWGNLFWIDWKNFDAVYMFWRLQTINKYRQKIENKVKSGQFIISYCFEIPWLKDCLVEKVKQDRLMTVYVYKI